jgi:hypothetical protein
MSRRVHGRIVFSIHDLRSRLVTPENAGLAASILLSVVGAYAIRPWAGDVAAFFGLIVLGVSTPTTLTTRDLLGERIVAAAVRASVACLVTAVAYVGLLTVVSGPSVALVDAAVAFVLTALAVEAGARALG